MHPGREFPIKYVACMHGTLQSLCRVWRLAITMIIESILESQGTLYKFIFPIYTSSKISNFYKSRGLFVIYLILLCVTFKSYDFLTHVFDTPNLKEIDKNELLFFVANAK